MRMLAIAGALQLALLGPAFPCEGQKGAVIFEDNFQDDSGGWDLDSKIHVNASELVMSVGKDYASGQAQNLTFNATDGDYCVEAVLPPAPKPAYIPQIGLEFWALSYNDQFLAYVQSTGAFLARKQGGNWSTFFSLANDEGTVNTEAGALNTIRIIAKNGLMILLITGKEIKKLRAQVPQGALRFGLYAGITGLGNDKLPADLDFRFKSIKVTAGE